MASVKGSERPLIGRPPGRPEDRRRNRVMLNFTDAEHDQLEKSADGGPVSDFAREIVLRYLARRKK
jgi:hypothetical protein